MVCNARLERTLALTSVAVSLLFWGLRLTFVGRQKLASQKLASDCAFRLVVLGDGCVIRHASARHLHSGN